VAYGPESSSQRLELTISKRFSAAIQDILWKHLFGYSLVDNNFYPSTVGSFHTHLPIPGLSMNSHAFNFAPGPAFSRFPPYPNSVIAAGPLRPGAHPLIKINGRLAEYLPKHTPPYKPAQCPRVELLIPPHATAIQKLPAQIAGLYVLRNRLGGPIDVVNGEDELTSVTLRFQDGATLAGLPMMSCLAALDNDCTSFQDQCSEIYNWMLKISEFSSSDKHALRESFEDLDKRLGTRSYVFESLTMKASMVDWMLWATIRANEMAMHVLPYLEYIEVERWFKSVEERDACMVNLVRNVVNEEKKRQGEGDARWF